MKIFNSKFGSMYNSKVNFVDDNNVLVGYDTEQLCYEIADWFISNTICSVVPEKKVQVSNLENYQFDTSFFKESHLEDEYYYDELDKCGMVIFRLVNKDKECFLHLYNCHNGYYSHGFTMIEGDSIIHKGAL